jgi:hypothetical protein
MITDADAVVAQVEKITGCVIQGTVTDKGYAGFVCRNPKTRKSFVVWVDSDEEGNAVGSLFVEEEGGQ